MVSRSEKEMMALILDVAAKDARILAVLQDGSRSNPNVRKDIFQDYDIIYVVDSLEPFLEDHSWIDVFGERMILQMPEDMELYPPSPDLNGAFSFLMQFRDGNRIDLVMVPVDKLEHFTSDSLCKVIWDKGGLFTGNPLPDASEDGYLVEKPTARSFGDCCNEFWYTNSGLAKGLWREELTLVKELYHQVIHGALMQMMDWYIGSRHDWRVNPGKFGKNYQRLLAPEVYAKWLATYSDANWENIWKTVYVTMELFREAAMQVSNALGYEYPVAEDEGVMAFVQHVQELPKDAKRIYTE